MKKPYRLYIIPVIFLFLASCIPGKEISFEYLSSSENPLPADAEKILVFNSSYKPEVDTLKFNVLRVLDQEEQFILDTLIVNNILNGFFYVADQSLVPALQNTVYAEQRGTDTTGFLQPLGFESIEYLLDEFESDIIISLEYYGMNYDVKEGYDDFESVAYLLIDRFLLWRIYNKDGLLREKQMRDTLSWSSYGENYSLARAGLPSVVDVIREVFWFAGEEFAMEISPSWKETERNYFLLTDQGTDRSLDEVFLRELVEEGSNLKKYMALFNLSVYHEKNGELEEAIISMKQVMELRPSSTLAGFYLKQQEQKLEDFKKLKEQLGE